jgi:hypothetical protein
MKPEMQLAQSRITRLLEGHESTAGLYVRAHGDHLIVGRREPWGPDGELQDDDRVRLTRLGVSSWGLSVKRHTGRWERTPFCGTLEEMVDTIFGCMQHLVAPG